MSRMFVVTAAHPSLFACANKIEKILNGDDASVNGDTVLPAPHLVRGVAVSVQNEPRLDPWWREGDNRHARRAAAAQKRRR